MNLKSKLATAGAALAALPLTASAELPTAVTAAFTEAATDAGLVWAAMVVIALVGLGFKFGIFGIKKAPSMVR